MAYIKTIFGLCMLIMVYQGISNTDMSIVSQLTHQYGNNWAGPVATALLYVGLALGSLYNGYIGKYKFKQIFFVGSFGNTLYIATGVVFMLLNFTTATLVLIMFSSFVGGCLASVFFSAEYNYVNVLGKIDNQEVRYFGLLLMFNQVANVFGSLLSSLLIQPLGQFNYLVVMLSVIVLVSLVFWKLPEPDHQDPRLQEHQTIITQTEQVTNSRGSPFKVAPCFCFTGVIIAFIYNTLSIVIYRTFQDQMNETELNRLTFIIFIFDGIGGILGGLFVVLVSKRISSPPKAFIGFSTLFIVAFGVVMLGSKLNSYYVIGAGAVLCGMTECICSSMGLIIAGKWEKSGFTAYILCQCLSVTVSTTIMVFLDIQWIAVYVGIFYLLCLGNLVVHLRTSH